MSGFSLTYVWCSLHNRRVYFCLCDLYKWHWYYWFIFGLAEYIVDPASLYQMLCGKFWFSTILFLFLASHDFSEQSLGCYNQLFLQWANSLNAIKILVNLLIAIDPTCHRHKKIPSMPFSGIQGIDENFNGIQGINSSSIAAWAIARVMLQRLLDCLKFDVTEWTVSRC